MHRNIMGQNNGKTQSHEHITNKVHFPLAREYILFFLFGERIFISPFHYICKHTDGKYKAEQKTEAGLISF